MDNYESGYQMALNAVKARMEINRQFGGITPNDRDLYAHVLELMEQSREREEKTIEEMASSIDDRSVTGERA